MKDFLGNEYDAGDKILYAAMSGRSVTMILAEVVEIYEAPSYGYAGFKLTELEPEDIEIHVKVQPLNSARWKQHYGRRRYIDTRTGKGIDPFSRSGKHMVGNYYENLTTDERYEFEDWYAGIKHPGFPEIIHYYEWGAPGNTPEGWRFVKQEFKSYVQEIEEGVRPVTLSVTDNIVLWRKKDSETDDG